MGLILGAADTCGGCKHDRASIMCGKKHIRTGTVRINFFTVFLRPQYCKELEPEKKVDASR